MVKENKKELLYTQLRKECKPDIFQFKDTSELEKLDGIMGQERAVKAMEFGLNVNIHGYNIYVSGATGTGKTSYASNYIEEIAKSKQTPDDWCYVYNFEKPNQPKAINMPAGEGKIFQKDMEEFIKIIKQEMARAFESEDYEKEKAELAKNYQVKKNGLVEKLNDDAKKQGFIVKTTNSGIYFLPVVDGKTISEEEFGELDDDIKHEISKKSTVIQTETVEIIRKIKNIEKEAENKIGEWENKIALFAVGMHVNDLKEKYNEYEKIIEYLECVQQNILDNLLDFREEEIPDEQQQTYIPSWLSKNMDSPTDKYNVNLFVDNSSMGGKPVIVDFNPTYYNLMGKLEYENEFGTMTTDFTMIKAGLVHQANGGYLILQAKDVLNNPQSWEALKRVLKTKEIGIVNIKEQMGYVAVSALKPEPIPVDTKVILVGSSYVYQILLSYDEDFKKLFKIKVDFDDEMNKNEDNIMKLSRFVSSFCKNENLPHFDKTGMAKVVEHTSRLVEDQEKMSTRFNDIVEILGESCAWASIENSKKVKAKHVKKAIEEKIFRSNKYDEKLQEYMAEGKIMIDTSGEVVGQINGLAVLDMGDYCFGKPSRITAVTHIGESGIVNIEREIDMSGTMHSKGVMILSGYLGDKYAQDIPLSLTASVCFEQLYSGIDGDSASSTELYAILSSLSGTPIKQYIAVTGSVNQKGEIQPVGGVTEKIEGFFALCKSRGLDGKHGVVIPHQNVKNLALNDEVVESVKKGKFHIYPVEIVDEGIEILTDVKYGVKNKSGNYPKGTINHLVFQKLKRYSETVIHSGRQAD